MNTETDKIKILEMLLGVKSMVLKNPNIPVMMQEVCKAIAGSEYCSRAWALLIDEDKNITATYDSGANTAELHNAVSLRPLLEQDNLVIIDNASEYCKNCKGLDGDAIIYAKRMKFEQDIYGVFFVSFLKKISGLGVEQQFSTLIDDISAKVFYLNQGVKKEEYLSKLKQSNHIYSNLTDIASLPVAILNLNGNIEFVSKSLKVLFEAPSTIDFSKEEFTIFDFLAVDLQERAKSRIQEVKDKDVTNIGDYVFKTFRGNNIHVRVRSSLLRNIDGSPYGIVSVLTNLPYYVNDEENIALSEEQFKLLFLKAPDGISLVSPEGILLDVNEQDAKMMKMKREDMVGRHVKEFMTKESGKTYHEYFNKLLRKGSINLVINVERADGTEIIVSKNASAIKDSKGFLHSIIVHSRDITREMEARKQINMLSKAVEQSPTIIVLTDTEGYLVYANKKFEEVTGYALDEVYGKRTNILKSGLLPDQVYEEMWGIIKSGGVWRGELQNKKKDGTLYWEYASISGVKDAYGHYTNMLKVAEDITERKETERELKEATVRYRKIFELVPVSIVLHREGMIVDLNMSALEFSKMNTKQELMGQPLLNFIHESSKKLIISRLQKLKQGVGYLPPVNAKFVNSRGEIRDVVVLSREFTFKGERAFMAVFEDITERKIAQERLEASEKRFRSFFKLIPDPVTITNIETGEFIEMNEAAEKISGSKPENIIGKTAVELNIYESDEQRNEILKDLREKGWLENKELTLNLFGRKKTILVSGRLLEPYEEKNVLMISHDITERKKMEEELVKAKKKAEEGERLKASFLSNISHEIRTPMNAILGFSDLLRDANMSEEMRNQYINIIHARGTDLLNMISNILDISKIESGSLNIKMEAVKVNDIIKSEFEIAAAKIKKSPDKNIELEINCDLGDDCIVYGDKYRIQQVFMNLIDNAIKFTDEGMIKLYSEIFDDKVVFYLEDTGCGIAPENLGIIFNRFVQVHDMENAIIGGAGLGLSISKSLLELMGGDISVSSAPGKGSRFKFSFMLMDTVKEKLQEEKYKKAGSFDWSSKTVLIAEDDPSNQMFIKVILSKTGLNILMANDGMEAVELFDENMDSLDIILLDIKMPRINGYDVAKYIKSKRPDLPVIALTANAMNNDREKALEAGCDDYMAKPIAKEDLFQKIEKFFSAT